MPSLHGRTNGQRDSSPRVAGASTQKSGDCEVRPGCAPSAGALQHACIDKYAGRSKLSPSPGTCSAPGRFPTSDCGRDFWGHGVRRTRAAPGGPRRQRHACFFRPRAGLDSAIRGQHAGHPRRRWMAAIYLVSGPPRSGHRGGTTVNYPRAALLRRRRLRRFRVGALVFLAGAVPLWPQTFDFGGPPRAP
jgi:hypothetical protein